MKLIDNILRPSYIFERIKRYGPNYKGCSRHFIVTVNFNFNKMLDYFDENRENIINGSFTVNTAISRRYTNNLRSKLPSKIYVGPLARAINFPFVDFNFKIYYGHNDCNKLELKKHKKIPSILINAFKEIEQECGPHEFLKIDSIDISEQVRLVEYHEF